MSKLYITVREVSGGRSEVETFFRKLEKQYPRAETVFTRSLKNINEVLYNQRHFKDSFLKVENSFSQVVSALGALGESLEKTEVVKLFGDIIEKKKSLCGEDGAWEQYEHLATWLAHLGTLIEIKGRSIEETYLDAVKFSMEHMSKGRALGYSWHAYKRWDARWKSINASNRAMIRKHILDNSTDPDAREIVSRG